jgi:hypothetical protein
MDLISGYEQGPVVGAYERGFEPSIPKEVLNLSTERLLDFQHGRGSGTCTHYSSDNEWRTVD